MESARLLSSSGESDFFSNHDFGMRFEEGFVIKGNIPDDAQSICEDAEFVGIAKMPIDVHLLNSGIRGSMGRHGTIGGFIRVKGIIQSVCLFKCFELSDDTVGIFKIVFSHPSFNARGIKEQHRCFFFINSLAYRFGQGNKPVKHRL